jgi:tRNA(Met) cytidine acetyltransferase
VDLQDQLNHWLNIRAEKLCYRQLMIVSGPEKWAIEQAEKLLIDCQFNSLLWVGGGGNNQNKIESKVYREYLGQEFSALIYNCYSGFRANAVMALSGTVKADGLMLLICPDFGCWPNFSDPERDQRISFGYESCGRESNFIKHLVDQIRGDSSVSILTPEKLTGTPSPLQTKHISHLINCQSKEQTQAIESIIHTALGHTHRPLVLSADRGRGKSSALGIAAASLIKDHGKKIILTAPTYNTVAQVFQHACELLPEVNLHKQRLILEHGSLAFMPPDALLAQTVTADIVMVDEAAAIPTPLLKKILAKYSRVVFSTTLHGYEGSGRGFELRFKKHLNTVCPEWKSINLTQPIRWYPEDVLERFWFRCMLMLKQSSEEKITLTQGLIETIELNVAKLTYDSKMLEGIFQLLVNAHYQTSPDDLVRLLDAPEQRLFILKQHNKLLGVALISAEGGEKLKLISKQIACGSRRVKGHLVPQYLTFHSGDLGLCSFKQWRIVRIVIEPELQSQALGTLLLNEIEKIARKQNIEFLSSAFGATNQLLGFWQKNLFSVCKLGFKRDASSSEHSAIILKPLTIEASDLTRELRAIFQQDLQYQSSRHFADIDTYILVTLLKYRCNDWQLNKNETQLIVQFTDNMRPLYSCEHVLAKLLEHCLFRYQHNLTEDYVFLVALLLQSKNDKTLCIEFSLSGKQQIQSRAQQAVKNMYDDIYLNNSSNVNSL